MHKRTANGRPKYSSTVCAQMFGLQCVHKCSSAQIVHRNIRRPIHRTANEQQTDSKRTSEIFINRSTSVIFCCVGYILGSVALELLFLNTCLFSISKDVCQDGCDFRVSDCCRAL